MTIGSTFAFHLRCFSFIIIMETRSCYHCGDTAAMGSVDFDDHIFCCQGCVGVYSLLKNHNLDSFYKFEYKPGVKPLDSYVGKYDFLLVTEIAEKFIRFKEDDKVQVRLFLPSIHCASCIYLLENLGRLNEGIISCSVSFVNREATILFNETIISLADLAMLLDKIGYSPNFEQNRKQKHLIDKGLFYQLGVAGFAFGSIMLWSFPEYLGIVNDSNGYRTFMAFLCFGVSIPVLLYSAKDFLISAYKALRFKTINLDVPISIGIVALYVQSVYAIFAGMGTGYMDSFAGFIFFLLIGKWFQSKTYQALSFERDYTAYFPLAANRIVENGTEVILIEKLEKGDKVELKNGEIIPCDAFLLSNRASLDYSFVTGESDLLTKIKGDFLYAGGKVSGGKIEVEVKESVDRSHLTSLWNKKENDDEVNLFSGKLSSWFLYVVLTVALIGAVAWSVIDSSRVVEIVVAVLIVACPCALALSAPFTYGNSMRLLGRNGFYVKNVGVIKRFVELTDIAFDKTGTLTKLTNAVSWEGEDWTDTERNILLQACANSNHPLNKCIIQNFERSNTTIELDDFEEIQGSGMQFSIGNDNYKLGNKHFSGFEYDDQYTSIVVTKNQSLLGRFIFQSELRDGIQDVVKDLKKEFAFHIISGDSQKDQKWLEKELGEDVLYAFNQSPKEKKLYIEALQKEGKKLAMVGDGLNDIGALSAANLGISVAEDVFQFTPAADAVLNTSEINKLPSFLAMGFHARKVLRVCFSFSLLYNTIGLCFALSGNLSPIVAAIIMPLSSITIVAVSTIGVMYFAPLDRGRKLN